MAKSRFPHPLVLIFAMIVIAQIATYLLPAGSYLREPVPSKGDAYVEIEGLAPLRERLAAAREQRGLSEAELAGLFEVSATTVRGWELGKPGKDEAWRAGTQIEARAGALLETWVVSDEAPGSAAIKAWKSGWERDKQRVVPGTYAEDEGAAALGPFACLVLLLEGLQQAGHIIFFVFIVGGVVGVLRATGAVDAMIGRALHGLGGRPLLLIAGMITVFAIGSSTIGMAEEYMPFVPILVTMCLALKMDAVVAMGIVYVGAGVGYGAASVNPFTVLIAQDIAGVEPTSGWPFRIALLAAGLVIGIHHVMRYARRIERDPVSSLVADLDYSTGFELPEDIALTKRRRLVLAVVVAAVALIVLGVAKWDWYFGELCAVFIGVAILSAAICGVTPNASAREFCKGAAEMTATALLIGFAKTIQVVLDEGQVADTVIHGIAGLLHGQGPFVSGLGMLGVESCCNFFVPSGSGQAFVTMPIMAPLADLVGVSRQVAVLAYQMGDGFTNMLVPTNALLMGMLALSRVPYQRWLRFVIPLMAKIYLLAAVAMFVAVTIGYS